MSVYKEIGHAVGQLLQQRRQIWNDACDYGVPVKSLNDPILDLVKNQILPMCEEGVKTIRYSTGATQTMKFDGGWPAVIEAGFEKMELSFVQVKNNKNFIGYICLEVSTSETAKQKARNYDN